MGHIQNPLPVWLISFLPLLIIGYSASVSISRRLFEDKLSRNIFSMGLYISVFLTVVVFSSMMFHSFVNGLIAGSIILCVLSIYYEFRIFTGLTKARPLQNTTTKINPLVWLTGIASTLCIFYIARHGYFHDEEIANGHKAIIAQLQNNIFPPVNILYPKDPLRYHFGFDILCASITAFTRCSMDMAIDLTTTLSWFFCWIGLALVARKIFPFKNSEVWVPVITMFGSGLSLILGIFQTDQTWSLRILGTAATKTDYIINPPLISYFFQHPFAAGLPLVISILILFLEKSINNQRKLFLISFLLLSLYFCQTVLFVTLFAAISFYYVLVLKNFRFILFAVGIVALAFISHTGLIFTPTNKNLGSEFIFRFWPGVFSYSAVALWYFGSVGLLIPFAIAGLIRLDKKLKLFFIVLVCITVCVPLFFTYKYAFDIVKFIAVGNFYLGILSGGAVAWVASLKIRRRNLITAGSFGLLTLGGFIQMAYLFHEENVDARLTRKTLSQSYEQYGHLRLNENYADAINWCRKNEISGSMFLDNPDYVLSFAVNSGLPTIYNEMFHLARAFATPEVNIEAYSKIFHTRKISLEQMKLYGVRWVLHDNKDDFGLSSIINSFRFKERAKFGSLELYSVEDDKPELTLR